MKKVLDLSEKVIRMICILSMAVMAILGILQVVFRYVLNNSLSFSEELMIFLFVWIIFLGAAISLRHGTHAAVGMLVDRFSGKIKYTIIIIGTIINIGFLFILVMKGFEFAFSSYDQLSVAMEIPMTYIYLSIPIGSALMLLYSCEQLYYYFIGIKDSGKEQQ